MIISALYMVSIAIHVPIPVVCADLIYIADQEILNLPELIGIKRRLIRFLFDGPETHINDLVTFGHVTKKCQLKK